MSTELELLVTEGPLKGRRFADACADGFAQFLRDFARITNQTDLYK